MKSPLLKLTSAMLLAGLVSKGAMAEESYTQLEPGEIAQGGNTTHYKKVNAKAFTHPAANMPFKQQLDFRIGNGIFKKLWVAAPSSTTASDGLGPLYNARSCMQCHTRDGRGHTPKANWPEDNAVSMFLRLSIPPQTEEQINALKSGRIGVVPDPVYGTQLQDFAVTGLQAEGRMNISYSEFDVELSGGQRVTLRRPAYKITDLQYGATHPDLMISPRIAPAMIGLGLLENIAETDIKALSDPTDRDRNGISGKPNWVWDSSVQKLRIGRFGWKAGHPSLNQQNNSAFNGDIGISTPYSPDPYGDCTEQQSACLKMANGNTELQEGVEASSKMNDVLLFYTRHIAVPARRQADKPEVLAGKKVFYETGCQHCHQPKFRTANNPELPQLSNQLIWPYTDMLLHDMGEGLADHRPEFSANGREWRTAPLWGIGLMRTVSKQASYLHDGRARTLLEAILWHGGEAETAMRAVKTMPVQDRDNLIKFLESL
ncbi:di-heme oxidoredictase family protein [Neptuniibacter caesariensis]|uniref:Lipoprotein, putative n=1 Tax=Neptuniibacter caesariensis TaxID=207954 RepID=A0A7U8GSL2_NEPCE|nr:di-heme oxidoredictase family protein [Neptuniibacter caesariensis]EAR62607.1 lipoprotein, putative [Oceanospirillum sp. MED92] [Neptuniibacter caesariensis]